MYLLGQCLGSVGDGHHGDHNGAACSGSRARTCVPPPVDSGSAENFMASVSSGEATQRSARSRAAPPARAPVSLLPRSRFAALPPSHNNNTRAAGTAPLGPVPAARAVLGRGTRPASHVNNADHSQRRLRHVARRRRTQDEITR